MKNALSVDFLVWKYIVPEVRPELFKSKLISLIAILYISVFTRPRKFMWHYFTGKGKPFMVDTKSIVTGNLTISEMLVYEIVKSKKEGRNWGEFYVGQIHVNNPNYKYSIGSFYIKYSLNGESVCLKLNSDYRFTRNNSRITKHLHNWLYSLKEKGYAHDFNINGNVWKVHFDELLVASIERNFKKYDLLNVLYV